MRNEIEIVIVILLVLAVYLLLTIGIKETYTNYQSKIPKIIHQTFSGNSGDSLPPKVVENIRSLKIKIQDGNTGYIETMT